MWIKRGRKECWRWHLWFSLMASHHKPLLHCVIQLSASFFRQKGSFWLQWCTARPVFLQQNHRKNPLLFAKLHTMNLYESDLRMLFLVNLDVSEKVNTSCMDMHWNSELSIILKLFPSSSSFFKTIFEILEFHQTSLSFQFGDHPPDQKKILHILDVRATSCASQRGGLKIQVKSNTGTALRRESC